MATQKLIAVKEFCGHHNIKAALILELYKQEMIELVFIKRTGFIPETSLQSLEKIIRLHQELDINIEAVQIILYLLANLEKKEAELQQLRNQLDFYAI
ncbi:hypothetical protein BH11BAC4_BH11BAC4_16840 [soil metagenome]